MIVERLSAEIDRFVTVEDLADFFTTFHLLPADRERVRAWWQAGEGELRVADYRIERTSRAELERRLVQILNGEG